MLKFDEVTENLSAVPIMQAERASVLRDLMIEIDARNVLELGTFHGKSAAYIGAILEDRGGEGRVITIDKPRVKRLSPNVIEVAKTVGLSHRIEPRFAQRSYTWELARLIRQEPRPQFDLCFLDGGHIWDTTGFGALLADMLLRPGGILVMDDLGWTLKRWIGEDPDKIKEYAQYTDDEKETPAVKLVFNTIVPHLGFERRRFTKWPWGIAQKPLQ